MLRLHSILNNNVFVSTKTGVSKEVTGKDGSDLEELLLKKGFKLHSKASQNFTFKYLK